MQRFVRDFHHLTCTVYQIGMPLRYAERFAVLLHCLCHIGSKEMDQLVRRKRTVQFLLQVLPKVIHIHHRVKLGLLLALLSITQIFKIKRVIEKETDGEPKKNIFYNFFTQLKRPTEKSSKADLSPMPQNAQGWIPWTN